MDGGPFIAPRMVRGASAVAMDGPGGPSAVAMDGPGGPIIGGDAWQQMYSGWEQHDLPPPHSRPPCINPAKCK